MRQRIKRTALQALRNLGIFSLYARSRWRRRRLAILCYHGISQDDEHLWQPALYMPPQMFEQRLRLLAEGGYSVLSLADGLRRMRSGELPPKGVAITFDDGAYDFHRHGWPLLCQYGFPATLYLTTHYCRHAKPVFLVFCSYMLWKARRRGTVNFTLDGVAIVADLAQESGRQKALEAVELHGRTLDTTAKDEFARKLAAALELDYHEMNARRILHLMQQAEVTELAAQGLDVQLHTHRHRTPMDRGLFVREIADNRRAIQEMTGSTATHFCYPSGVYDSAFLPWLEQEGVESATTCELGLAAVDTPRLLLPRVMDHSGLQPVEVEAMLLGVFPISGAGRTHTSADR